MSRLSVCRCDVIRVENIRFALSSYGIVAVPNHCFLSFWWRNRRISRAEEDMQMPFFSASVFFSDLCLSDRCCNFLVPSFAVFFFDFQIYCFYFYFFFFLFALKLFSLFKEASETAVVVTTAIAAVNDLKFCFQKNTWMMDLCLENCCIKFRQWRKNASLKVSFLFCFIEHFYVLSVIREQKKENFLFWC